VEGKGKEAGELTFTDAEIAVLNFFLLGFWSGWNFRLKCVHKKSSSLFGLQTQKKRHKVLLGLWISSSLTHPVNYSPQSPTHLGKRARWTGGLPATLNSIHFQDLLKYTLREFWRERIPSLSRLFPGPNRIK